jgi:hypothetical protein
MIPVFPRPNATTNDDIDTYFWITGSADLQFVVHFRHHKQHQVWKRASGLAAYGENIGFTPYQLLDESNTPEEILDLKSDGWRINTNPQNMKIYNNRDFYIVSRATDLARQANTQEPTSKQTLYINETLVLAGNETDKPVVVDPPPAPLADITLKGLHICLPDTGNALQYVQATARGLSSNQGNAGSKIHMTRIGSVTHGSLPHTVFYISHTLRKRALVDRKEHSRDGVWRRRFFVVDDGKRESGVEGEMIRSRDGGGGGRGRTEKFEEDDKVEANYKGKGKYYPGKISRARLNGTYDIAYDDKRILALVDGSVQYDLHTCLGI